MTLTADSRLLGISACEIAAFVAVVDHDGFTAAARALHLSQPGVSARIRRLERALGVTLFDRAVRRLTLTPAGHAFLPHARAVMDLLGLGWQQARVSGPGASCPPAWPRARAPRPA